MQGSEVNSHLVASSHHEIFCSEAAARDPTPFEEIGDFCLIVHAPGIQPITKIYKKIKRGSDSLPV
ncbi:hypothetical protein Leryth_017093 [Lithospermum erythrorhizon]|nr:hypothetical protein Leryth_017093 [Lithospermum erythrorhizon]